MATDPQFFHDLAWVIVAAVVGGALAWLARQPVLLGYLVGGVLVGRFTPGPTVSDTHTFEVFAEIGVVLLMFSIGIEFSLRDLLRVRWVALIGGPLGIVLTAALGAGAGFVLGWPPLQGLAIGLVISVASTMVLVRLLIDRGELHTRHGQVLIGISLIEDLAVVALTILLPALGTRGPERPLAVLIAIGKAIAVLGPVLLLAVRGVPPLMRRVARTQNDELFLLLVRARAGRGRGRTDRRRGLHRDARRLTADDPAHRPPRPLRPRLARGRTARPGPPGAGERAGGIRRRRAVRLRACGQRDRRGAPDVRHPIHGDRA